MNLNQLQFASAVAKTKSFTMAAQHCAVTQPTLSNAIAQLEEELGHRLFVRTTRKVALTPFGTDLLPGIERVLGAKEELLRRAKQLLVPEQKLIRIGVSPLLDERFLGLLLEPFLKEHPDTELTLCEMDMPELGRMLEGGQLDYVFGVVDHERPNLRRTDLYREALMYVPKGKGRDEATVGNAVRFLDICDETFVMVSELCGLAQMTRELFRRHRRKLREYSGIALSYRVLEQWAVLGVGAAIMPRSKISNPTLRGHTILDKHGKPIVLDFKAFWTRKCGKNASLTAFTAYMQTTIPALAGGISSTT